MAEEERLERIKIIYTEDSTTANISSVLPVHSRTYSFPEVGGHRSSTNKTAHSDHHLVHERTETGVMNPAFIDDDDVEDDDDDDDEEDEKVNDNVFGDVQVGRSTEMKPPKMNSGYRSGTSEITLGMKLTESNTVTVQDPWEKVRLQNLNKGNGFRDSMLRDLDTANSTLRDSTFTQDSIQNEKRKTWDAFRLISKKEDTSEDIPYFNTSEKIAKILVGILLTLSLATLTLVSKSSLLLITSNLYQNVSLVCHNTKDGLACRRLPLSHVSHLTFVPSSAVQVEWLWALVVVVCAPYAITSFRCMWRICFKKTRKASCRTFFVVFLIETIHTSGLTMFVFLVLPSLDAMRGEALMLGGAVFPALLKLFDKESKRGKRAHAVLTDIVSFIIQLSVLVIWPVIESLRGRHRIAYFIPISLLLISFGWWENYINQFSHLGNAITTRLKELKRNVRRMRPRIYLLVAPWKILLTLILVSAAVSEGDIGCLRLMYFKKTNHYTCSRMVSESLNATKVSYPNFRQPYWIALVQISSCFLCFLIARNACKMMLQVTSFAIPLSLSPPLIMAFFIGNCESWRKDQLFNWLGEPSVFWTCDLPGVTSGYLKPAVLQFYFPVVIAWWFSYLWVTAHIWFPRVERLVQTERLFVQNYYCDIFLQHSLTLNRRRDDKDRDKNSKKTKQFEFPTFSSVLPPIDLLLSYSSMRTDTTPMIFVCATMWHETEKETINILTSIFRLDSDQSARRHAQRYFDIVDPDYYEFEGHIFFDDAFEAHSLEEENYTVNGYVKQLINSMNTAANVVHKFPVRISSPILYDTPYGGRLEWKLPGGNRLSAHLKDKQKIRHRKRWSQVMYMYYLLGYRLINQPMNARRKQTIADHTFLLALDGDVDFKPAALQLLVDRMKMSDKVAAACGRIHPKGSGPILWYQKFEYAISHWLQKSTEHMIGCVLCSPGCFSLFRGSALMDDNVMRKYAIPPTEARHYVQYDQGEDRWLCTLLLQQGYRVEYCAASDAMTFAPEGFNEFFNQRRRWSPSTMANILDLLQDWRHVIRVNENISGLYIFYQLMLFVSAIMTPGTIFLLIVGAVSTAFPSISLIESFFINLIPLICFVVGCFLFTSEMQLMVSAVMSCIYTLVMMLVLIGLALQMTNEGICSPTTIFFIFMVSIFLIAGILHPQEFVNLLHGPMYFLTVPSTSMLMILYAVCNLNIVSWGTRETKRADGTDAKNDNTDGGLAQQKQKGSAGWRDQKWLSFLNRKTDSQPAAPHETSDYAFSFGNLCKCMCCPKPTAGPDVKINAIMDKLERIERSIHSLDSEETECVSIEEVSIPDGGPFSKNHKAIPIVESKRVQEFGTNEIQNETDNDPYVKKELRIMEAEINDKLPPTRRFSLQSEGNRLWQQDPDLLSNKIRYINRNEWEFWEDLIARYLHPIDKDEMKQAKIEEDLNTLRNQVCLFFFIVNGLFIVVIFTLQLINSENQGKGLAIPLPCTSRSGVQLTIEPISLLFMIIFGVALTIQFFSMVFHRLGTLHHIIASTDINCLRLNQKETASMDIQSKIQLVRELQGESRDDDDTKSVVSTATLDSVDEEDSWADEVPRVKRRKTVMKIVHNKKVNQDTSNDLGHKFVMNFMKLADDLRQTESDDETKGSDERSKRKSFSRKSRKANPKGSLKLKKKQSLYALAKLKDEKEAVLSKAEFIGEKLKRDKQKQKTRQERECALRNGDEETSGQIKDHIDLTGEPAILTNQKQVKPLKMINEEEALKRNTGPNSEAGNNARKQNGGHEENTSETRILVTRPSFDRTVSSGEQSKTSTLESSSIHDGGDRRVTGSPLCEGGLSDTSRTDSDIQLINHYFEGIEAPTSESNSSEDEENLYLPEKVSSQ